MGEPKTVPWWSAGALLRARWTASPLLFAEVVAGAAASLTRPVFVFETPYVRVYQPEAVVGHAALSAGATFP
jgi:hypothetical protein